MKVVFKYTEGPVEYSHVMEWGRTTILALSFMREDYGYKNVQPEVYHPHIHSRQGSIRR